MAGADEGPVLPELLDRVFSRADEQLHQGSRRFVLVRAAKARRGRGRDGDGGAGRVHSGGTQNTRVYKDWSTYPANFVPPKWEHKGYFWWVSQQMR